MAQNDTGFVIGGDGTGTTFTECSAEPSDDTERLQAMIDAGVKIPPGYYRISTAPGRDYALYVPSSDEYDRLAIAAGRVMDETEKLSGPFTVAEHCGFDMADYASRPVTGVEVTGDGARLGSVPEDR